ncbi:filamentous hemagglutinin N-terminal domain-containing protein [Baaleninema sp.]|uniref:two-partner secretion domain-containing protein n=1 Tax=Baaleninema sp. TaxID=3101197 RepID=UPI003CFF79F2
MKRVVNLPSLLFLLGLLQSSVFCIAAGAQIVPDGTLSTEVNSSDGLNFSIEGGDRVGNNLFHSFQDFSVPTDGSAVFNQAIDIETILSRVTGNSLSNIDGLIRANGAANLFLINPNGIIFGPNARLDIGGSFLATTANSVVFENGLEFSAANPENITPLLSVNVPLGVQFGENPGTIQGTGAMLNLPDGESLAFVGGSIALNGVRIAAPGGRVELGGVSHAGIVALEDSSLAFPVDMDRSQISLNGTVITVAGDRGGDMTINGSEIAIDTSILEAGIAEGLGFTGAASGNIELNATGQLNITNSDISNIVGVVSTGNAGDISITANTINLRDESALNVSTLGEGNAGTLNLKASETITLANSMASSAIFDTGRGNAGNINVVANTLEIRDGAFLSANTRGEGDGGTVTVEVTETVVISGTNAEGFPSGIGSQVGSTGRGNAGGVRVFARTVEVRDGGSLSSSTFGEGDAGTLTVEAIDRVSFLNGNAFSNVAETGRGNAGGISIVAHTLEVLDGAELSSNSRGRGDAGTVTVEATDNILLSGSDAEGFPSGVFSDVLETGQGNAGDIRITADTLEVRDGALLFSSTFGQGNAGTINVEASDRVLFAGSNVEGFPSAAASQVADIARGNAGDVRIVANTVEVRDGALLDSSTFGEGNGGTVTIEARDTVFFAGTDIEGFPGGASSQVGEIARGNAGDIRVVANTVEVHDGARLSSSTFGEGNGGTVTIEASDTVLFSGSSLAGFRSSANSQVNEIGRGNAGNVSVFANTVEIRDGAGLSSATFGEGNAGTVSIEATDRLIVSNGSVFSDVEESGRGDGGDIRLVANRVTLRDRTVLSSTNAALVEANDFVAGDVILQGDSIELSEGVEISADTLGRGGNVRLDSQAITLRRGSNIQTNAEGNFPGGNITLNTGVLAALENSDISANAANSFGGRVTIDAQGIFGTAFRERLTPESDITATSALGPQFSGIVEINTPDIDATAGLVELPENIEIPRLARGCQVGGVGEARFVDVGRAGVPPTPYQPLSSDGFVEDRRLPRRWRDSQSPETSLDTSFQEAQNWIISDNDRVVLFSEETSTRQGVPCGDR